MDLELTRAISFCNMYIHIYFILVEFCFERRSYIEGKSSLFLFVYFSLTILLFSMIQNN